MWFDESKELLGSHLRISFACSDPTLGWDLLAKSWQQLTAFHQKYSRFIKGNYLEVINSQLNAWQEIDAETYALIEKILHLQSLYGLHFSLAVKSTLENLGYDQNYSFQTKTKLSGPLQGVVQLKTPNQLYITAPIEFGGFGKGYALDLVLNILKSHCPNICLDFGGDLYAQGQDTSGHPWKIILENPLDSSEGIGSIVLDQQFLTASSGSKRHWGKDQKLHHLIDPGTGKSAQYWLGSFVLANSGIEADWLATALFCTPQAEILSRSAQLTDTHFLLIAPDKQVHNHQFPGVLF